VGLLLHHPLEGEPLAAHPVAGPVREHEVGCDASQMTPQWAPPSPRPDAHGVQEHLPYRIEVTSE